MFVQPPEADEKPESRGLHLSSRILLADDSPHAQRMGERILGEEGYEVVSVTDGDTALKRLADVDPDLLIADVFLPGINGFDLCRKIKASPRHAHVRVVMTAGMLEVFDEDEARRAGADAIIKKPFEASVVIGAIQPLITAARNARDDAETVTIEDVPLTPPSPSKFEVTVMEPEPEPEYVPEDDLPPLDDGSDYEPEPPAPPAPKPAPEPAPVAAAPAASVSIPPDVDAELVRAAVTVALDEALPALIDDITERVIAALRKNS